MLEIARTTGAGSVGKREAAAINEVTGEFHPFQVTAQRKRKHRVEEMAREFPLALISLDLLYANGKDYTNEEYESRRAALERIIKPDPNGRKIPPGTQPGAVLLLRGKGLPEFGSGKYGDLFLRLQAHVPEKLSAE